MHASIAYLLTALHKETLKATAKSSRCCSFIAPRSQHQNSMMALHAASRGFVTLDDGTELPYETQPAPFDIILGHGLGSDPTQKSHENDISTFIMRDALDRMPSGKKTAVFYTARGHGASQNWQSNACAKDFLWPNLAKDMMQVAAASSLNNFVAAGQSMGAASAFYMTMAHADKIKALILMRPPRAWEERERCAPGFIQQANDLFLDNNKCHFVMRGAAETDLPPKTDKQAYKLVSCPVLLLCHGKDESHPIATGRVLAGLLPNVRFEISEDEDAARRDWPAIIADWSVANGLVEDQEVKE